MKRRSFLQATAQATLGGALIANALRTTPPARAGSNDPVRVGFIGCGNMGNRHLKALVKNPQCQVVAVCDVNKPRYEMAQRNIKNFADVDADGYQDYRYVLDRKDVDAIFCATCDHWHPLVTIHGCEAGKDVYVEKPISPTVVEGRKMVEAARHYGRVVQVGTQQRSMPIFDQAIDIIHSGKIGQITSATAWIGANTHFPADTPADVPEGLDWDLWLGPAPKAPYSVDRYGGFRSFYDYCRGGELANWAVHLIDIIHWGTGQDQPLTVQASGGHFRAGTGADNYENIEAVYEYPGCLVTWEQRHTNQPQGMFYGISFYGTEGSLFVDRGHLEVVGDKHGIGTIQGEPEKDWANPNHHNNFFDCVRTRQRPVCDIETGHRTTTAILLPGIALKTRRRLEWDGTTESFVNDAEADRHLARPYRAPWTL